VRSGAERERRRGGADPRVREDLLDGEALRGVDAHRVITSRQGAETCTGMSELFVIAHGWQPVTIAKRMTPSDHTAARRPSYCARSSTATAERLHQGLHAREVSDKGVLGLQVAVRDTERTAVAHRGRDLRKHARGDRLRKRVVANDVLEQLAARAEVHQQIGIRIVREELPQRDDAVVPQERHRVDLALEALAVPGLRDPRLRDNLARAHLRRRAVHRLHHDGERAVVRRFKAVPRRSFPHANP
jgi:hypothetical protein